MQKTTTGSAADKNGTSATGKTKIIEPQVSRRRLRLGLGLWVISYLPFPLVLAWILHRFGLLASAKSTSDFVLIMWGIQIVLGLIGLWVAGKEVITSVREQGMRRLPGNVWGLLFSRTEPIE